MDDSQSVGSWRELGSHFGTAVVLAGGVLVGAVNIYLAASLLPTAVADIGGVRLYAGNMTVYENRGRGPRGAIPEKRDRVAAHWKKIVRLAFPGGR
ncbi:hypothetical protein AB0D04_30480 [Streptomyces sp. NPDC048483]|uniref:hypothetical protein n=1 Tax=Streptomyces sp. NPDC048483 TaxID=3154927 RepID=UPI0034218CF3